jgi:hypothetical protein
MNKIQKYNEIQQKINALVFKSKMTPKDYEKLDNLHEEQEKISNDHEIIEYLNNNFLNQ